MNRSRFVYLTDQYGRECGLNLDAISLYVPEGTQYGDWEVRVWVHGGPVAGLLLRFQPLKFKEMLESTHAKNNNS
jgi:hypothetical protein